MKLKFSLSAVERPPAIINIRRGRAGILASAGLFFSFCLAAGAQSGFQKYFSELIEYQKFSLSPIDSSYVIAGSRWGMGTVYDFCAVKLDKNGNVLWSKTFPSPNDEFLSGLSVSPGGDIVLSGYKSNNAGEYDFSLMKLDVSGTLQWYKAYGTANMEVSVFSGETPGGDFLLAGNRDINQRPGVLKINNSGIVLWSKTFGSPSGAEEATVAALTKEGGMVVFGALPSGKNFLMKIKPDGTIAWTNTYTTQHGQFLSSIKQTGNGGFVVGSTDYRCDASGCFPYFSFIRLDSSGNVSWAKAVEGGFGWGRSAVGTSDGGFVFTGQIADMGGYDAVLIKISSSGNLQWAKSYGSAGTSAEGFFVEQTPDGGFALFGIENSQAYLIKTDANGNSGCNEKTLNPVLSNMNFAKSTSITVPQMTDADTTTLPVCADTTFTLTDSLICSISLGINDLLEAATVSVYPNPFSESAVLVVNSLLIKEGRRDIIFTLYDIFGREVMRSPITDSRLLISRGNLTSGMYFYEVRSAGKTIGKGKLIAE